MYCLMARSTSPPYSFEGGDSRGNVEFLLSITMLIEYLGIMEKYC